MKIIRNSSYTSDGIFSWSQIYIQCLFLVCCMRFLWVFLHFIFFGWIYYEFRKRILNKCLCVYYMHIIWPFYDTIDSCCMQFTKTRKIMCLLRHCACLIICICIVPFWFSSYLYPESSLIQFLFKCRWFSNW